MFGALIFLIALAFGITILGSSVLIGLFARRGRYTRTERISRRLTLELGALAVTLALIPLFLLLIFDSQATVWRLDSFLLIVFLFGESARLAQQNLALGRFRLRIAILFLAFSGIFLTIESVNVFWWGSMTGYAGGLLWIVILSGIQFVYWVGYDRTNNASPQTAMARRRGAVVERLQRDHYADYPDGASYRNADAQSNAVADSDRRVYAHRLAFTRSRNGYGRTVADPFGRPTTYRRRRSDRDPRA